MKVSLITTVLNEEKTIGEFLESVYNQTRLLDEVIIVDGGSTDATVKVVQSFQRSWISLRETNLKFLVKRGNRAVGRNEAIKRSTGDIIACTDGDCILDKDWVKNIIKPFSNSTVDIVAGYYKGRAETVFQKCLVPYVLVMEDKINSDKFLPASRSMAFRKNVWKTAGGFPEKYSHNEDYVFAKRLEQSGIIIGFAKDAIVYWRPRKNIREAFIMFFRFAYGDMEARIIRQNVIFLFFRYFLGILLLIFVLFSRSIFLINILTLAFIIYIIWSVQKNYRYVNDAKAFFWLPVIQFTADIAVILGSIQGFSKNVWDIPKKL